jgi:CubicO group peptidase (beta-lactamase class C family)
MHILVLFHRIDYMTTKRRMYMRLFVILLALLLIILPSCGQSPQAEADWPRAVLEDVDIDAAKVLELIGQIEREKYEGLHSMIIVKDGKLVHESYFAGHDADDLHRIYSVSKSVTSLLIGIAIDRGMIENERVLLQDLLPAYHAEFTSPAKKSITLKQVLTMSAGFEWDEDTHSYGDSRNSHRQMDRSDDWLRFVLSRPLQFTPGERWIYNTGNTHLLAGIIKVCSDLHADEFAEKYLFEPLGIRDYDWNTDGQGYPCVGGSGGGLRLRSTDLAKIGQLILNKGMWQGKRVVSEEWIERSTAAHIRATMLSRYGYQWWRDRYRIKDKMIDAICGYGYGGQSLQVYPQLDLVVVFTSWSRRQRAETLPARLRILNATVK